jgi:putative acetyltransferase
LSAARLSVAIRAERPADVDAIDDLNRAAFGGPYEADLVARLRADGLVALSLVAAPADGAVVGHILLSPLPTVMDGRAVRALALAPMAVAPAHQGRGVGSRLVSEAIARAKDESWAAIVVLGHPRYYPRFGFSADLARRLQSPFAGDAFMALELAPGALAGAGGAATYPAAFGLDAAPGK